MIFTHRQTMWFVITVNPMIFHVNLENIFQWWAHAVEYRPYLLRAWTHILYCLKLRLVSYKRLVSFSGWGNSIITRISAGSQVNAGSTIIHRPTKPFPFLLLPIIWNLTVDDRAPPCNTWSEVNKISTEYGQLSDNCLSLPCIVNSSCGLSG